MPTLLIELPEAEYRAALALPERERRRALSLAANHYATAKNLRDADEDAEPTEEDLEAVGEGLAALDAGQTVDADEFFKNLEEQHGWKL